jgi:transposase
MERSERRSFTDDCKRQGSGGRKRPVNQLGGQGTRPVRFGIASLSRATWSWARADGSAAAPHAAAAEIARLQQENERLRMEPDILKKSLAIFAGVRT